MNPCLMCQRCLYTTSHPLGLILDDEGICSGCRIHEEKDCLDWSARWEALRHLVQPYRCQSGRTYDCVVPVSGAGDSYYIMHVVKERLKLNPLMVTNNNYFNTPLGVWNLANLRIRFNSDIVVQNVNPNTVKKITRSTLREFGSIYWPCHAGQTAFPMQTAIRYNIPLVIWGAHQGLEQVGMYSHEHEVEMTRRYRQEHDLMGREADDLLSVFDTLTEDDIWQYRYPEDNDIERVGVRGIYLGNFVRWDPKAQHEEMMQRHGYRSAQFSRTFDSYDHVDCYNYMTLHDQLKFFKHGYSKVTDHACREIRHGRLSRKNGIRLVNHYQTQAVQHADKFCEWMGMDSRSLSFISDQFRNPLFWAKSISGTWTFTSQSADLNPSLNTDLDHNGTLSIIDSLNSDLRFCHTDTVSLGEKDRYITVGKGYP